MLAGDPLHPAATGRATGMRWVPGGTFHMGADNAYPEEAPAHTACVGGFWMDECAVTNAEFALFVAATDYRTVAERPLDPAAYPGADPALLKPGNVVFFMPTRAATMDDIRSRWAYVPGVDWLHPEGPSSSIEDREQKPVVHIAFEDAAAYPTWAGKMPVADRDYQVPFRSTGKMRKLTLSIEPPVLTEVDRMKLMQAHYKN